MTFSIAVSEKAIFYIFVFSNQKCVNFFVSDSIAGAIIMFSDC